MLLTHTLSDLSPKQIGRYVYRPEDYSFDFEPLATTIGSIPNNWGSMAVGTIELSIDLANGALRHVSGFCPVRSWARDTLHPPKCYFGSVVVKDFRRMQLGVTYPVDTIRSHSVTFDPTSRWLRIGEQLKNYRIAIQYAPNSFVEFEDGKARSVWILLEDLKASAE